MHVGILKVDSVSTHLAPQFGEYSDMVIALLEGKGANFSYSIIDVENETLPGNIDQYDAFIITGSKKSVYEDIGWINDLKRLVIEAQKQNKKMLGICFGHQLLAVALGGEVEKSAKGWGLGLATFDIKNHEIWQKPVMSRISLLMSHQDQVTRLPPDAQLIAGNEFCPYACFQLGENVLGLQGHPEFSPAYLRALMLGRLDSLGKIRVEQANKTLGEPNDNSQVANWMIHFIRG